MCCRSITKAAPKAVDASVLAALDYLVQMYGQLATLDKCNTQAGHWINEAFVVRLWAILEAHHVVDSTKSIDMTMPGAARVDLCRRLRQKIAHATGRVTDLKLDQRLRDEFGLGDQESIFPDRFILSKDKVLGPMYEACRSYTEGLLEVEGAGSPRG